MAERERNLEMQKASMMANIEKSQKEQEGKLKRLLIIEADI